MHNTLNVLSLRENIKIRKEFFGAIIFNAEKEITIKIDMKAYEILKKINQNQSLREFNYLNSNIRKFILQLSNLGILYFDPKKRGKKPKFYEIDFPKNTSYLSFPESLHLTITYKCNQNCRSCYYSLEKKRFDMDFLLFKKIIDEVESNGILQISIGGGEPFCHPNILEFLDYANKKSITTNITTNGTMLDAKIVNSLENLQNLGRIQISLDGSTEEINNRSREKFKEVIKSLTILSNSQLKFGINVLVCNSNVKDLPNMFKLSQKYHANTLNLLRIKPPIKDFKWFKYEKLNSESLRFLIDFLERKKHKKYPEIYIDGSFSYLFQRKSHNQLILNDCSGCSGGLNFLTILPDGIIIPCTHLRYVIGNAKEGIKNVWHNSEKLKILRDKKNFIMNPCKSCNILNHCGGCRALALEEFNNFRAPDPECLIINYSNSNQS